jgi:hexosaminidase
VEYFVSDDAKEFKSVGRIVNSIPLDQDGPFVKEFETALSQVQARYVKIVAKTIGVCPPWHPGAGKPSWIFADEIVIE